MTRSIMRRVQLVAVVISLASACGGGAQSPAAEEGGAASETSGGQEASSGGGEFQLSTSDTAGQARGEHPSEIEATPTHAAMRLFVVDPETGPSAGIVMKLTAPNGQAYYTNETDSQGYAEVLVPVGQRYEIEYLSLGRRSVRAHVEVPAGPNQDIRLTLRYRARRPPARAPSTTPEATADAAEPAGLVLEGILFESNRATLQEESNPRLDRVVEYLTYMTTVRIRVAGHTDNVGNPARNQLLSEQRAQAVRDYLVAHGIDASRIEAVGYGDQHPVASNDTEEGRQQNRRIEAEEL